MFRGTRIPASPQKKNTANMILMSVPHRHDLIRNSCVNNAVEAFDRGGHEIG
jgi:hypothetical protein